MVMKMFQEDSSQKSFPFNFSSWNLCLCFRRCHQTYPLQKLLQAPSNVQTWSNFIQILANLDFWCCFIYFFRVFLSWLICNWDKIKQKVSLLLSNWLVNVCFMFVKDLEHNIEHFFPFFLFKFQFYCNENVSLVNCSCLSCTVLC